MPYPANEIQRVVDLVAEHGTYRAAAAASGLSFGHIQRRLNAQKALGVSPTKKVIAEVPLDPPPPSVQPVVTHEDEIPVRLRIRVKAPSLKPATPAETSEPETEIKKPEKPVSGGTDECPEDRIVWAPGDFFAVATAYNNTIIDERLVASLLVCAQYNRGEFMVCKSIYNKAAWAQMAGMQTQENLETEKHSEDDDELWYDPRLAPYFVTQPTMLGPRLLLCAELRGIVPTAVDPLSGFESYTRHLSGIIPHAKAGMRSYAVMENDPYKMLWTTGTVTKKNYTNTKAGRKAEFHHQMGAIIVEIDRDGTPFPVHVNANKDGSFQYMDRIYTPTGVRKARVKAITCGDFHVEKSDEEILGGLFDQGGMLDVLDPEEIHVHDLFDNMGRNHHNLKDPYFFAERRVHGDDIVEHGIQQCADLLLRMRRRNLQIKVITSNHDQAFARWLKEGSVFRDPQNARYFHTWNARTYEAIEQGRTDFYVFEAAVREKASLPDVEFIHEGRSHRILTEHGGGIECGLHGHQGPNGSRGGPRGFKQIGVRCNIGHSHTPGIWDGVYYAGVSGKLNMGYNNGGPSSWAHAHIVTYPNAKRAIIVQHGAKWRAERRPANDNTPWNKVELAA